MGAKQAVGVVAPRAIAAADDPEAEHDRLAAEYAAEHLSAAIAAREGFIDELVEPRDTRRRLAGALRRSRARASTATAEGTSRCDHVRRDGRQLHRGHRARRAALAGPARRARWAAATCNLAESGATSERRGAPTS